MEITKTIKLNDEELTKLREAVYILQDLYDSLGELKGNSINRELTISEIIDATQTIRYLLNNNDNLESYF